MESTRPTVGSACRPAMRASNEPASGRLSLSHVLVHQFAEEVEQVQIPPLVVAAAPVEVSQPRAARPAPMIAAPAPAKPAAIVNDAAPEAAPTFASSVLACWRDPGAFTPLYKGLDFFARPRAWAMPPASSWTLSVNRHPKVLAAAQKTHDVAHVLGAGDDQDLLNAGLFQLPDRRE
ncbi:MAG: hypothetical protein H6Q00_3356 [Holophagaceae bacterium]|nr:hypothetical protein [Holophagaceae bacterium]